MNQDRNRLPGNMISDAVTPIIAQYQDLIVGMPAEIVESQLNLLAADVYAVAYRKAIADAQEQLLAGLGEGLANEALRTEG